MSITITLPNINFKPLTTRIRQNAPAIGGAIALSGFCYYVWTQTNISYYMGLTEEKKFYSATEVCEMKGEQEKKNKDQAKQVEESSFRFQQATAEKKARDAEHEAAIRDLRLELEGAQKAFDLTAEAERKFRDEQYAEIERYKAQVAEYDAGIEEWKKKLGDLLDKEHGEDGLVWVGVARSDRRLDRDVGVGATEADIHEAFGRAEKAERVKTVVAEAVKADADMVDDIVAAVKKNEKKLKKKSKGTGVSDSAKVAQPVASSSKLPVDTKPKQGGEISNPKSPVAPKGEKKAVDPPGKGENYYKKPPVTMELASDLFKKVEASVPGFKKPSPEDLKNPAKYTKVTEHLFAKVNLYRRQRIRQLGDPKKVHELSGLPFLPKLHRDALEAECSFFKSNGVLPYGFENMSVHPDDAAAYKQDVSYGLVNARAGHSRQQNAQIPPRRPIGPSPQARNDAPYVAPYPFAMGSAAYLQAFGSYSGAGPSAWDGPLDDDLGPLPTFGPCPPRGVGNGPSSGNGSTMSHARIDEVKEPKGKEKEVAAASPATQSALGLLIDAAIQRRENADKKKVTLPRPESR